MFMFPGKITIFAFAFLNEVDILSKGSPNAADIHICDIPIFQGMVMSLAPLRGRSVYCRTGHNIGHAWFQIIWIEDNKYLNVR